MSAVLALILLLLNGFFVAAEFAVIAVRSSRFEQLAEEGNPSAIAALKSAREGSLVLAGAQLGITMASLGLGAVAEPALAHGLERLLSGIVDVPETVLHTVAFIVALGIVVFFHMVVGEMAPKNIAISRPEGNALAIARPMRLYVAVFRPLIHVLNIIANAGVRLLGVQPQDEVRNVHTTGEIALMVRRSARGGLIQPVERKLLEGAISFSERDAASIMVPRTDLVAAPLDATPADLEALIVTTGHSRIPVYNGDMDDIAGFIHAKDLLEVTPARWRRPLARSLVRPMLVVPESRRLHPLLLEMKRTRQHLTLVVDEHGGTSGIVTLEDLLEELVGEIQDEHDPVERGVTRAGDDRYLVPGALRVDEAEAIGLALPEGDYETVAGFIMDRLGRIPKRRDVVSHEGWRLTVVRMKRRRIVQVMVEKTEDVRAGTSATETSG